VTGLSRPALAVLAGLSSLFLAAYLVPDVLMHHLGLWTMTSVRKKGVCALTFDDGPDPVFTPLVLDVLRDHGFRATFFVLGKKAAANPEIMDRMVREGHEVGVHGWDHRHPWLLDPVACVVLLKRTLDGTRKHRRPGARAKYRPCWGFWSLWVALATSSLRRVMWSVAGNDWKRGATPESVVATVSSRGRDGDIVLLHDGGRYSGVTARALPAILMAMEARGLRQVTLEELER
jgi:peptidoglycan/xylan/chitin deacetylase (PgdA/CDA1 family)